MIEKPLCWGSRPNEMRMRWLGGDPPERRLREFNRKNRSAQGGQSR